MTRQDNFARRILGRLQVALPDAAAATVAAGLAWTLSRWLFGHPHPVFAAVTAIICLAPGLPNHGRQAVGLVLGVATGILVGELAFSLPGAFPELRIVIASFVAIMIAAAYGLQAVVPIQAGVSALLVLALGPESAGVTRLLDVFSGISVGLLFSQVLFTGDPVRQLSAAKRGLLAAIGQALAEAETALAAEDQAAAQRALKRFSDAHKALVTLTGGVDTARSTATWSLRGRLSRHDLRDVAARFERRSTRVYAAALLFGAALATALERRTGPVPETLAPGIATARALCDLDRPEPPPVDLPLAGLSDEWRRCVARLGETMEAVRSLRAAELPD
ncbi:MAG: hypothetical protein DI556_18350 [Rhodovulum sulfidophilum]|uniref:Integral membrane bound transporter domain-containing protein n=1 Tax=Rhodovulum sulfidophilum TaxID=35806 RepID=A0A2W5N1A8_RHOSU|nr:MAG: hypothetical protein DI556_18350 [Rhodovulum sulfidophilum]